MKRVGTFFLLFSLALFVGSRASLALSPRPASAAELVLLGTEFRPGETVRYTFSQKMNLTIRVNPRTPPEQAPPFIPRRYQVEGEITATFDTTQPGEPLHGAVQFKGLVIKNWVSPAQVADLETCLRQLESVHLTLTTASSGNLELSEARARLIQDRYVVDVEDLRSIAQAVFISRISSQPLARGQQRESADFPIPGMIKPGIKMTILTEYLDDVPIANRPSAEVRLTMSVPYQSHAVSPESGAAKMLERLDASGVWTYLLDLGEHQVDFLHKTVQTETSYSVESTDNNESVRIPQSIFTVNKGYEVTARRVAASGSPARAADLAAFEESLHGSTPAGPMGVRAEPAPSPGGEVSLGDLARRMRTERAAQGPAPAVQTNEPAAKAGTVALAPPPAGFKPATLSNGEMTVLVPAQSLEVQRTSDVVKLRCYLEGPATTIAISMTSIKIDQAGTPDELLDSMVKALRARTTIRVLQTEKKKINGESGVVVGYRVDLPEPPFEGLEAAVVTRGKAFVATCGTRPGEFLKVGSVCLTILESLRVP